LPTAPIDTGVDNDINDDVLIDTTDKDSEGEGVFIFWTTFQRLAMILVIVVDDMNIPDHEQLWLHRKTKINRESCQTGFAPVRPAARHRKYVHFRN
jgi:hypothetical protein